MTQNRSFVIAAAYGLLASFGVAAQDWSNTYEPPTLSNPLIFTEISELPIAGTAAYGITCAGKYYKIKGGERDVYIDLSGKPALRLPILVESEGNVILRGITIEPMVQPGCGVGQLPNKPIASFPRSNVKPRPPTGRAMGISVKKTAWIEGVHIKYGGQNGDCVVWTAAANKVDAYSFSSRFYFVNSRCDNYDGHGKSNIGDSLHADLFQNWRGAPRELYFENIEAVSGNQGIVNNLGNEYQSKKMEIRNFAYLEDSRYQAGPVSWGPMISTDISDENLLIKNAWMKAPGPAVWGPHSGSWPKGWRFVPHNKSNGEIPTHSGITWGTPPRSFAPPNLVGTYYRTPFRVYGSGAFPTTPAGVVVELKP